MRSIEIPKSVDVPPKILGAIKKQDAKFRISEYQDKMRYTSSFCPDKSPRVYACRNEIQHLYTRGIEVDSRDWPNRTAVSLSYEKIVIEKNEKKIEKRFATGVMVGPKHVLTFFQNFGKTGIVQGPDEVETSFYDRIIVSYSGDNYDESEMLHQTLVKLVYFSENHPFVILILDDFIGFKTGFISINHYKTSEEEQRDHIYTVRGFPEETLHFKKMAEVTCPNFEFYDDHAKGFVVKTVRNGKSMAVRETPESKASNLKKDDYVELDLEFGKKLFKSKIEKDIGQLLKRMIQNSDRSIDYLCEDVKNGYKVDDFCTIAKNTKVQFAKHFVLQRNTISEFKYYGMPFVSNPDKEVYKRITDDTYRYRWEEGLKDGTIGSPVTTTFLNFSISGTFIVAMHSGHEDGICKAHRITEKIFNNLVQVLEETWNYQPKEE